jgi:hypothetical protein
LLGTFVEGDIVARVVELDVEDDSSVVEMLADCGRSYLDPLLVPLDQALQPVDDHPDFDPVIDRRPSSAAPFFLPHRPLLSEKADAVLAFVAFLIVATTLLDYPDGVDSPVDLVEVEAEEVAATGRQWISSQHLVRAILPYLPENVTLNCVVLREELVVHVDHHPVPKTILLQSLEIVSFIVFRKR